MLHCHLIIHVLMICIFIEVLYHQVGKDKSLFSRSSMSVIKPSVVTDTTLPANFCMLCKHSPRTLLMNAVVQEAKIWLDNSVLITLTFLPVKESKHFYFTYLELLYHKWSSHLPCKVNYGYVL